MNITAAKPRCSAVIYIFLAKASGCLAGCTMERTGSSIACIGMQGNCLRISLLWGWLGYAAQLEAVVLWWVYHCQEFDQVYVLKKRILFKYLMISSTCKALLQYKGSCTKSLSRDISKFWGPTTLASSFTIRILHNMSWKTAFLRCAKLFFFFFSKIKPLWNNWFTFI